jgi:hypothetical protein
MFIQPFYCRKSNFGFIIWFSGSIVSDVYPGWSESLIPNQINISGPIEGNCWILIGIKKFILVGVMNLIILSLRCFISM